MPSIPTTCTETMDQEALYNVRTLRSRKLSLTSSARAKKRKLDGGAGGAKDMDSIEYVDRLVKYYSQAETGSILDETQLFDFTSDSSSSPVSEPRTPVDMECELDYFSSQGPEHEPAVSFVDAAPEPYVQTSTCSGLEDFIYYEDEQLSSDSDVSELDNTENTTFYNIFDYNRRKLASLDYRCHGKLNLALVDVAPRKYQPTKPKELPFQPLYCSNERKPAGFPQYPAQPLSYQMIPPQVAVDLPPEPFPQPRARKDLPGVIVTKSAAQNDQNPIDYKTKYYQYLHHKYGRKNSTNGSVSGSNIAANCSKHSELALNKRSMLSGKGNEMVGKEIMLNELF